MDNSIRSAIRYWLSTGDLSALSEEQAKALHTLLENHINYEQAETEKVMQNAPLRSAEQERRSAVAWNRMALSLDKEAKYWRSCFLKGRKSTKSKLPEPLINEHGKIVVEASGALRPYLWIDRHFASSGGRSDLIGFTFSDQINDCRPHEGTWSITWEELLPAIFSIYENLEDQGAAPMTPEHIRERFEAMMSIWGSMPYQLDQVF